MTTNEALWAPFVPPERWGALLHRTRTAHGRTLAAVSRELVGWTPQRLADVERGGGAPEAELEALAVAYRLSPHKARRHPWRLVLDRATAVGGAAARVPRAGRTEGLLRLRAVLGVAQDVNLVTGGDQLMLLAEWIGTDVEDVLRAVASLPGGGGSDGDRADVRHRLCVPAIGLLIGTTVSGSLALVGTPSEADEPGAAAFPIVATVGEWARLVNRRTALLEPEAARG